MIQFTFLFLISVLVFTTSAKKIAFENCGGEVKSVDVEPCESEPCEIPKGSSAIISVHCVSNVDAAKLRLTVWANLGGLEVPYPGMKRDACKGKNITCPITKNQDMHYTQKFEVRKFFPSVETKARFNLKTDDNQDKEICCFKAPVKVVKAEN